MTHCVCVCFFLMSCVTIYVCIVVLHYCSKCSIVQYCLQFVNVKKNVGHALLINVCLHDVDLLMCTCTTVYALLVHVHDFNC
jgi:hypothetical protein